MILRQTIALLVLVFTSLPLYAEGLERPRLLVSAEDVAMMSASDPLPPLFATALEQAKLEVDHYLEEIPDVPSPRDAGGGYTHEQHKRNSAIVLNAGLLFQLTGNEAYADLARDILQAYAEMYPDLPIHPEKKEQSPGKLFWQSLNEAVWLVTSIQGYDLIYEYLRADDRAYIESNLFRPMVSFISVEATQTFDRIHNHGTWAVAAVGMTGYVLGDADYVGKALYGLNRDGSAGFLKQIDRLFSPDGYYSEGPYYQRYALMPFLLLAKAIERNDPQRAIFQYRDGILLKAINTTIQLSYGGYFFPINDAIKDKGLDTVELCYGVSIAFGLNRDARLLSVAEMQDRVVLTGDGFRVAKALQDGEARPYIFESTQFFDGPDGDQGVLSILRTGSEPGHQALVFKATVQGMRHGHFDRLAWLFYDNGREIVSDYGAARFLNVEAKHGGHYLPENNSWAKQTVAHNTLVVDQSSQFDGDWEKGELAHPEPLFFETGLQADIVAATMAGAYPGVTFRRALLVLKSGWLARPVVLDVLKVEGGREHQYDLPLYFQGQVTSVSHELDASTSTMSALGEANGYQHLWQRARAAVEDDETFQLTWLNANRFYTYTVHADGSLEAIFTETGANDPEFNLRREQGLLLRTVGASNHTFVAALEPHGEYNGSREFTTASTSQISEIRRQSGDGVDVIRIVGKDGRHTTVALSWNPDAAVRHSVAVENTFIEWSGFYHVTEGEENEK